MEVQINEWAVLLAAISVMVVGAIWYSKPVFGSTWQKLAHLDDEKLKKAGAQPMIITFIAALLTAYVLAHVTYLSNSFFKETFMTSALMTAFWVWLGFSATTIITHNSFEQKRKKLTLLAVGNQLVTFIVMGLIIGTFKP